MDDKRNGRGRQEFPDGRVYDGEWKDGKFHGYGKMIWPDGFVYQGEWKDNMRHGRGEMTHFPSGYQYVGSWQNDKRHGRGDEINNGKHGRNYFGEWKEGKRHGQGVSYNYEGTWDNDDDVFREPREFNPSAPNVASTTPGLPKGPPPSHTKDKMIELSLKSGRPIFSMGFDYDKVIEKLNETDNDENRAIELLLSEISSTPSFSRGSIPPSVSLDVIRPPPSVPSATSTTFGPPSGPPPIRPIGPPPSFPNATPSLPRGWIMAYDQNNCPYYYHSATNTQQWTYPNASQQGNGSRTKYFTKTKNRRIKRVSKKQSSTGRKSLCRQNINNIK